MYAWNWSSISVMLNGSHGAAEICVAWKVNSSRVTAAVAGWLAGLHSEAFLVALYIAKTLFLGRVFGSSISFMSLGRFKVIWVQCIYRLQSKTWLILLINVTVPENAFRESGKFEIGLMSNWIRWKWVEESYIQNWFGSNFWMNILMKNYIFITNS